MTPNLAGCCMSLLVVGINHNSASLALRERVSIAPAQMTEALRSLSSAMGDADTVILSTCNRTELYVGAHAKRIACWIGWQLSMNCMPMSCATVTTVIAMKWRCGT